MLAGDLGFRAVVVLVLVVFSAIGLYIRRKWRLAVARREEIRRLLALASEEAARAELEASIEYAASSAVVAPEATAVASKITSQRYCAVCYSPTISRCRRCKSVWYCSSKCQVIHWRQGHKRECSELLIDHENNVVASKLASESLKENHHDEDCASKSSKEESESDGSRLHAQDLSRKDNIGSNHIPGGSLLASQSSSVPASSMVSASSVDHETHDTSPVSEDESLHDLDASDDGLLHPLVKTLEASVESKKLEQTNSVPSSGSVFELANNLDRSCTTREECHCISTSASDSDESIGPEPSAISSGFWDGSLESSWIKGSIQSNNVQTWYRNHSPDLQSEGSEQSYHTAVGAPRTSNPIKEAVYSGKEVTNSSRSNESILTSQQPIPVDKGRKNGSNGTKPEQVKHLPSRTSFDPSSIVQDGTVAIDSIKDHGSPSYGSVRSIYVNNSLKESSQLSMSEKVGTSQNASEVSTFSDAKKHSTSTLKPLEGSNGCSVGVRNQASSMLQNATNGLKRSTLKVGQPRSLKISKYYSFGVGSVASANNSERGLFPYELFVKLYNWNKEELRPCGLINCGNSCYANAVLQCLTFTPPLTAYFLQGLHSRTCAKKDWCFTCEFERLILMAKDRQAPLSPIGILSHIEKIGSHLTNGREEDAHEFLRYAIDTMQSICLQGAGVSGSSKSLEEETTLMGLTFGGYLRSKIRCMRCRGKSERHERMMDLTVEIGGDIETLEEALQKFTGTESLDGENKYKCSRCKSYEKAKKKLTILEAPNVLTIALKRFQSGKFGKLNKSVRFPDILNLTPYMRAAGDNLPIYRLYGVVVHLDIMNATFSGHYVSYIRSTQNKWFKVDDSTVKAVDMENVMKKGAYMLFYSRISPRAPQSIRRSLISHDVLSKGKSSEGKPSQAIDVKGGLRLGGSRPLHPGQISHHDANLEAGFAPRVPFFREGDSSSETSSIFSQSEEGASTTDDSNRESTTSADDLLEHIFGDGLHNYSYWRNSSDSDTSSSSSTSSSPLHMTRRSPLSQSERYASVHSDLSAIEAVDLKCGGEGEASFWPSDIIKQGRKLVNSSSCRETDSLGKLVGSSNPLDSSKSGVYLRPPRKQPD